MGIVPEILTVQQAIDILNTWNNQVEPHPIIGDEDSIYLTDYQKGLKDGYQDALYLLSKVR